MAERIDVGSGVSIPGAALSVRAVRSSGPGGQNVNKVASKVELRVDLERIEGLSTAARRRLDVAAASRLDAEGRLLITSQLTRDQSRNVEDAREKVRSLVARALVAPRPRRPTRVPRGADEKRLRKKKARSAAKRDRRSSGDD